MAGKRFRPALESPYRWRDWAAKQDGITGDELIAFVNNEEAVRPDGKKGPGLFAYLRGLQGANGGDRRDVIATVFKGTINRMINGYLLRDVINKVSDIHFTSSDEIHTLGHLYESMLKEMRDAAGDSGEFYTPRAVVRFMVEVMNPQLGEVDPRSSVRHRRLSRRVVQALGEAVQDGRGPADPARSEHLRRRGEVAAVSARADESSCCTGWSRPRSIRSTACAFRCSEIGDRDRVDVIMTNPPFGGEEESGIHGNFPEDKQTSETALLFLQLIMRRFKRPPKPGRAAVVVPERNAFRRRNLPQGFVGRASNRFQFPYYRSIS